MKTTIVGAGPGGLYLAILLAKANPAHETRVIERNAPDATFGWGVVFSDETLGALRDADPPTHVEITDSFARWDAIDIRYRDQLLQSRGHAFSAISRKDLLAILQRRCHELNVKLEFGVEIDDPTSVSGDLVVAADGVNSTFRRHYADEFGSKVEPQGGKYVWFGTDLVLDAFRFIFRQTRHGLFQVHSYPYDENTSTFIVECRDATWRRAGLDQMSEAESIAFCEDLFADDLDGHRLMSNRSLWLDFLRVSNRTWHHGNLLLLGDAAHTAHFSIGSGTKLAMEDAIALANAFTRHADIQRAVLDYELERQAIVERVQQAADESAAYFMRVEDHCDLEPQQFAFNLLTRSGRITHTSLALRDPEGVRSLDSWFDATARGTAPRRFAPPPIFAPFTLKGLTLPNRLVTRADDPHDGAGLVVTDTIAVTDDGRLTPTSPVLALDLGIPEPISRARTRTMVVLGHAGARGATRERERGVDLPLPEAERWPLIAASALPYAPGSSTPEAMDIDDMARIRDAFATGAQRAAEAGADALAIDMAHGYLLASFLSPLTNRRTDSYGGSLGNRLRFPREVLDGVRAVWSGDRPLVLRLTATDWARGGLDGQGGIEHARALSGPGGCGREGGPVADMIWVEAGQTVSGGQPQYRRGFLTVLSDRVRNEAKVPTIVGGHLTTADELNTIVAAGRADLVLCT